MTTKKKTVLIVDDVPTDLKLLTAILGDEGYETKEAADGIQALRALEETDIDLIISDILMPNMDGLQLCREVRRSDRSKNTPFIFYSDTYTSDSDRQVARSLGADGFLIKSASPLELREAIEATLTSADLARPAAPGVDPEEAKHYEDSLARKLEKRNGELAQRAAELQAGELRMHTIIETEPDCVQVLARDGTPAAVAVSAPAAPLPGGTKTILLVEDNQNLRKLTASILELQGYTVFQASCAKEALSTARQHTGTIDLLLTDVVMPEGSGKMVAEWMCAIDPATKVLFTSGFTNHGIVTNGEIDGGAQFLQKPYTPASLIRKVREVMDRPGSDGVAV